MKLLILFCFTLAAVAIGGATDKPHRYVHDPALRDLPFSSAVFAGDTLYVAGHIGLDPSTRKPPERIEDEARVLLDSVQHVVEQAGLSMEDVVQVTVFCPDLSLYERFNAVYRSYFPPGRYPARAFIGSGPLLFGAHFEITAVAVKQPKAAKTAGKNQ